MYRSKIRKEKGRKAKLAWRTRCGVCRTGCAAYSGCLLHKQRCLLMRLWKDNFISGRREVFCRRVEFCIDLLAFYFAAYYNYYKNNIKGVRDMNFTYFIPTRIVFGSGVLRRLHESAAAWKEGAACNHQRELP